MKNIIILLILLGVLKNIDAQTPEFLLPLYLSDSKGNKDTVFTGYDINAQFGFSEGDFAEKDIKDEPFEKSLDARVGSFKNKLSPSLPFMSKRFVERRSCSISTPTLDKGVNTLTLTKNFPITISWDSNLVDKNCIYNSFFHRKTKSQKKNDFVKERIYLRDSVGRVTLTKTYLKSVPILGTYDIILDNGDTLYCMILYLLDKNKQAYEWNVATEDIREDANTISISPNPAYATINVKIDEKKRQIKKLEIIDATGSIVSTNVNSFLENKNDFDIDIGLFLSGLYFVKVNFDDGSVGFKRFLKL
jgi:Secretion system C-terminal sorting domain